jgi:hypothetical protein
MGNFPRAITKRLQSQRYSGARLLSRLVKVPQLIIVTLISILVAALLYLPPSQKAITAYRNIDTIFIAAGGMIGTVIALIFSLSIIVVQRAAETFTPFITRLYREGRKTHTIFIVLVLFCVSSFLFSIDHLVFGISQPKLLPLQIVIIALTYDLSRLQYRRVSELMDTNVALDILLRKMFSHVERIEKYVKKAATKWKTKFNTDENRELPVESFESAVYRAIPRHTDLLAIGLGEMAELGTRAISKGEIHSAQKAISCISALAIRYLDARKANILLLPASTAPLSGVIVGDVDQILEPLYEHLMEINRRAVENRSQAVSIAAVECLGGIGQHLLSMGERSQRIAWKPIGYLGFCVRNAQKAQLHDVALRSSRALLGFVYAVPSSTLDIQIYIPVIQLWRDIAIAALAASNGTVGDLVLQDVMSFLSYVLKEKLILFKNVFSLTIDEIYRLIPLCLANEAQFGSPFSPYQMTNMTSIGYLVEAAAGLMVKLDEEDDEWTNPYDDFIELNKKVSSHFRHLGEKFDIGNSQLVWEISQTIKYVSDVFLRLVDNAATGRRSWLDDLVNQVSWHISFFWATFDKATKINQYYAYSACDQIALIAMAFYERGFSEILQSGVSAIRSIAVFYSKKGDVKSPYQIADILQIIWHLRVLAEAKGDATAVGMIDQEIKNAELWKADSNGFLAEAFEERKHSLKREMLEINSPPLDDSTSVLKRLLHQKYPGAVNKILEELYPGYRSSEKATPAE